MIARLGEWIERFECMWLTATGEILHRVSSSPASAQQSGRHRRSLYSNDVVRSMSGWRATKVLSVYKTYVPINVYGTGIYDLNITKMMAQSFDITFVWFMYGDFLYTIREQWEQKQTSHVIWLLILFWCDFDRASSLICGNKMPTRWNRGFYCRSYCLLNMFRASLCPSSGAQEYLYSGYCVVFCAVKM